MAKFLYSLMMFLVMNNCNSQKVSDSTGVENTEKYFLGTWYFTQKNYLENEKTKVFALHKCMKAYALTFTEERDNTFLLKSFASGENCTVKSTSGKLKVHINESQLSYFEEDLKRTEQFKIYSKAKFSILYRDIINGKVTEIEDFYEKKN